MELGNETSKTQGTPCRKYIRENLKTWITYQNQAPYYQYLELIEKLVQNVFKQEKTVNPLQDLSFSIEQTLNNREKQLFRKLVHALTLLNHTYRTYTNDGYISCQEDVLNAAALLQLSINPKSMLFFRTKLILWEIQQHFHDREFTVKDVSYALQINKKTLSRHIIALRNTGHIKHTRTGIRNTYFYELS